MRVIDNGHRYSLDHLDTNGHPREQTLTFVKRVGEEYPGNFGEPHQGTTTQDVLRALIDRTRYVNAQVPHPANARAMRHMREALRALESRAAERRNDAHAMLAVEMSDEPEWLSTCATCGHVFCSDHQ